MILPLINDDFPRDLAISKSLNEFVQLVLSYGEWYDLLKQTVIYNAWRMEKRCNSTYIHPCSKNLNCVSPRE